MPSQGRDTSLYGTAAVFGIALILACYRRFWLVAGILTYWGSGRAAPRSPPLVAGLFRLARGLFCSCVRPPPSRGCARVLPSAAKVDVGNHVGSSCTS